jgi:ABC-type nitrate/sulfonate/bicarbonate transport system substrate-binding protein
MRTAVSCNNFDLNSKWGMATLKKRNLIVIAVIILVIAIVLSSFVYLNSQNTYKSKVEPISIGMLYPSEYDSLIYIANNEQYFSANGLKITLKNYPSGASAVAGMLKGEVDVSTASEFVVVNNAMRNASLYAFGSVSKYINLYVVARTDQGINVISDLAGKRIGVTLGTGNQFYLGRFLELNGINQNQVTLVNLSFAETPTALENGTIDASITFQPYLNQIQNLLGNRIVIWRAQADQFGYFEAICTKNWAIAHPDLAVRFLKALKQAENFNINHKDQAIEIVAKNLNYTNSFAASDWSNYQYSVTLDQSFILLMQDEARWLIDNNLTSVDSVPNFISYVYVDGLKSVSPESVNIIGLGTQ